MNRTMLKVGFISFFADVSSEFLYPITPLFLTTVLGADATALGLIEGCAEASASLLKTFSGKWSDQIQKRKPFIWAGYLIAALAKPITGIAHHWTMVLGGRVLDRTGKGLRTAPRDALIAEVVDENEIGKAFGFHRAMDSAGAVLGPLLALVCLYFFHEHLRPLYFFATIPGLISVWIALTLPESKKAVAKIPTSEKISIKKLPKPFFIFMVIWGIFSLVNSSDAFIILRAKHSGLSTTHTVLLYAFFNVLYSIASYPLGKLSDRIGPKPILVVGLFLFALVYAGFAFASAPFHFWILFALYGVFMAMTDGVGKAMMVKLIPAHLKGTALGFFGTVTGLMALLASMTAGLLWDHFSPSIAFLYGSAGAVVAGTMLFFFNAIPVKIGVK